jgi:hypothetical protein
MVNVLNKQVTELTGETSYTTDKLKNYPLYALTIYGKSVQNGTPTPEVPVDIVSVGDDKSVIITVDNGSNITFSATITNGLPLCSIGNVRDELIYNADGTGKIIKRTGIITFDGSSDENWQAISSNRFYTSVNNIAYPIDNNHIGNAMSTAFVFVSANALYNDTTLIGMAINVNAKAIYIRPNTSFTTATELCNWLAENPVTVVYQLAEQQEIELTAAEMAKLQQLETLNGVCNIYNSGNGEMYIRAMTAGFEYGHEVGFFDSKI